MNMSALMLLPFIAIILLMVLMAFFGVPPWAIALCPVFLSLNAYKLSVEIKQYSQRKGDQ